MPSDFSIFNMLNPISMPTSIYELLRYSIQKQFLSQTDHVEVQELISRHKNWNNLLLAAKNNGVVAFLHHSLQEHKKLVPNDVWTAVETMFDTGKEKNEKHFQHLREAVNHCAGAGLEIIPYKGPSLSVMYPDTTLRTFLDLDVIIHEDDVRRSIDIFRQIGYSPKFENTPRNIAHLMVHDHALEFVDTVNSVEMDVHWRLAKSYYKVDLDMKRMWERSEMKNAFGTRVRQLHPEDLFLSILVHHGMRNYFKKMRHICDFHALVNSHPGLDWNRIHLETRKLNLSKCLYVGLRLCEQLLGTTVPPEIASSLNKEKSVNPICQRIKTVWLDEARSYAKVGSRIIIKSGLRDSSMIRAKTVATEVYQEMKRINFSRIRNKAFGMANYS